MPEIKYYWGSLSQPSRAIKAFLADSGIEHECVHVDMLKGEHKSEAITAVNPAGTLPFLTIDGKLYKETVAVMRYLANKFPENAAAYPDDVEQRFVIDKACDFYTDSFRPAFIREIVIRFGGIMGKRDLTDNEKTIIGQSREMQDKVVKALEDMVEGSGGKFACGEKLTLADYIIVAELQDLKYLTPKKVDEHARAKQYEADVLAASAGMNDIHKADGEWATQVVPAAQGMFQAEK